MATKPSKKPIKKPARPAGIIAAMPVKPTGAVVRPVSVAPVKKDAPVSRSWWWPFTRTSAKSVRQAQLAEVKAQVMSELKTLRAEQSGEKVSSRPFEKPMLPENFGSGGNRNGGDRTFWMVVVVGLLAVAGLLVWGSRAGQGPEHALATFAGLAQERDLPALEKMTDTPAREALAALFRRVPVDELVWGESMIVRKEPYAAEGEVALELPQVLAPVMARVTMRKEGRDWRVEEIDNMGDVIGRLEEIRRLAVMEPAAGETVAEGKGLRIEDVKKGPLPDGAMAVEVRLVNTGDEPIKRMKIQVMFGDSAGRVMKSVVLCHADPVNVGETLDRTWRLPVESHMDAQLAALPMGALTIRADVVEQ